MILKTLINLLTELRLDLRNWLNVRKSQIIYSILKRMEKKLNFATEM